MPQLALWNSAELHLNSVLPCGKCMIPNCTVLSITSHCSLPLSPSPLPPFLPPTIHHNHFTILPICLCFCFCCLLHASQMKGPWGSLLCTPSEAPLPCIQDTGCQPWGQTRAMGPKDSVGPQCVERTQPGAILVHNLAIAKHNTSVLLLATEVCSPFCYA